MSPEEQQGLSQSLDLIIGGGGASVVASLLAVYNFLFKPKIDDLNAKIKEDSSTFIALNEDLTRFKNDTRDAVGRLDNAESRIEDFVLEARTEIAGNKDRLDDFRNAHTMLERRINDIENRERSHYEELSKMSGNTQLLDQRLAFLEENSRNTNTALAELTKAINTLTIKVETILVEKK